MLLCILSAADQAPKTTENILQHNNTELCDSKSQYSMQKFEEPKPARGFHYWATIILLTTGLSITIFHHYNVIQKESKSQQCGLTPNFDEQFCPIKNISNLFKADY